jgi:membrane-bound serine protease (ClpP class)
MDSLGIEIAIAFGLIATGVLLLGLELLVIPGFGVTGIAGLLMMGAACVYAWIAMGQTVGLVVCGLSFLVAVGLTVFALRSKAARRRLVLDATLSPGDGNYPSSVKNLVGRKGVTKTMLRPSGVATIDGCRVDVVSEGGFVEQGTEIEIVLVEGPRVVVRRTNQDTN